MQNYYTEECKCNKQPWKDQTACNRRIRGMKSANKRSGWNNWKSHLLVRTRNYFFQIKWGKLRNKDIGHHEPDNSKSLNCLKGLVKSEGKLPSLDGFNVFGRIHCFYKNAEAPLLCNPPLRSYWKEKLKLIFLGVFFWTR